MSGSNICDGLITTLTNASAFDAGNVSKESYSIMETTSACALVVMLSGLSAAEHTPGAQIYTWELACRGYIKDDGDAVKANLAMLTLMDEVPAAIRADPDLNSSACRAIITAVDRPLDVQIDFFGNTWLPVEFHVQATEVVGLSASSRQSYGRDIYLAVEDTNGSQVKISGDMNVIEFERDAATPEITRFGATAQLRLEGGIQDWTLSGEAYFNDSASGVDALMNSLIGQQTVFYYGPGGSTSGNRKYSGSSIVQRYISRAPVDGIVRLTFRLVASAGSLTAGTF